MLDFIGKALLTTIEVMLRVGLIIISLMLLFFLALKFGWVPSG